MDPLSIIERKRDGGTHGVDELEAIVRGTVDGSIPDYQLAAWLMAVVWRGMTSRETADLTLAMARSGRMLDLSDLPGPVVDKHSTGGVGDKVSLVAGPLAAATGLTVAKMSGRGLGHTGGTLDKLESIPGLTIDLAAERFREQARVVGLVIAGQTDDLAPADKHLYALRDVTGTVPSLPLIAASIMCKKIAAGAGAIALDVKVGGGAFMRTTADARKLARTMVALGDEAGRRTAAALTTMDQPLGHAVGNALEVREAIDALHGRGPVDLREVALVMAGLMHVVAGSAVDVAGARDRLERALRSGDGLARLAAMIEAQGGDPRVIEDTGRLPRAPVVLPVLAARAGIVASITAVEIGRTVVDLGGGRRRKGDVVDPAVGIEVRAKIGDLVGPGDALAMVHARSVGAAIAAAKSVAAAYSLSDGDVDVPDLLIEVLA